MVQGSEYYFSYGEELTQLLTMQKKIIILFDLSCPNHA